MSKAGAKKSKTLQIDPSAAFAGEKSGDVFADLRKQTGAGLHRPPRHMRRQKNAGMAEQGGIGMVGGKRFGRIDVAPESAEATGKHGIGRGFLVEYRAARDSDQKGADRIPRVSSVSGR